MLFEMFRAFRILLSDSPLELIGPLCNLFPRDFECAKIWKIFLSVDSMFVVIQLGQTGGLAVLLNL